VVSLVRSVTTGQTCALKTVVKTKGGMSHLKNEAEIGLLLDHPNISRLYDVYEDHQCVYMVFEACNGGELLDRILEKKRFGESDAVMLTGQVLWAVNYLHAKCIVHRDIKLENLLFKDDAKGSLRDTLKLIDFGYARKFTPGRADLRTVAGSAYYVAPEIICRPNMRQGYNEKVDLWSVGVVFYMLLTGLPPFSGANEKQILKAVAKRDPKYSPRDFGAISAEAKRLINLLLRRDAQLRVSAVQALSAWRQIPCAGDAVEGLVEAKSSSMHSSTFFSRLKAFGQRSRFEQAARHLIARRLDEHEIEGLREVFRDLDTDGDGMLDMDEAQAAFGQTGLADKFELTEMFRHIDADGDSKIDYSEFIAAAMSSKLVVNKDVCLEAFRAFDQNGDGKISQQELTNVLTDPASPLSPRVNDREIQEILREVDSNGDGYVDFDEFLSMMRRWNMGGTPHSSRRGSRALDFGMVAADDTDSRPTYEAAR